jgi:hypothetical protein
MSSEEATGVTATQEPTFRADEPDVEMFTTLSISRVTVEPLAETDSNQPPTPMVKSYPLRERTFQQRMPYTADKQWHARLIGRGTTPRHSLPSGGVGDEGTLADQDDEEDPDYEEHLSLAPDDLLIQDTDRPSSNHTGSIRLADGMDFSLHDSDDDFPTIKELHRRSRMRRQALNIDIDPDSPSSRHVLPKFRIPTGLDPRTKRKLERLAAKKVIPLESLDADLSLALWANETSSLVDDMDDPIPETSSPLGEAGFNDDHPPLQQGSSDDNEGGPIMTKTKKHKKFRQHVLPMAFFKKNMLPDDAAALRALRSERTRSRAQDDTTQSGPDSVQLAHHAKRRILSKRDDGALNDYFAQLGKDKSDSEDESMHSLSEASVEGPDDVASSRRLYCPTLRDTIAVDSPSPPSWVCLNRMNFSYRRNPRSFTHHLRHGIHVFCFPSRITNAFTNNGQSLEMRIPLIQIAMVHQASTSMSLTGTGLLGQQHPLERLAKPLQPYAWNET